MNSTESSCRNRAAVALALCFGLLLAAGGVRAAEEAAQPAAEGSRAAPAPQEEGQPARAPAVHADRDRFRSLDVNGCLLYTSDAADE